jgi:hypothetical protein
MKKILFNLLVIFISVMGALVAVAGTLDNAPFQVVLPNDNWKLNDSTAQEMGKDVYLVASITNTNTQSKSVAIRSDEKSATSSTLDELCAGMRDSFSNPIVKKLSDEPITFLGFEARHFTYEVNGTSYNEAIVFVSGNTGWTIMCSALLDKKIEVKNLFAFYQKQKVIRH